jgi:hypothetical protein
MRKTLLVIGLIAGLVFIFSGCEKKVYVVEPDATPPSSPKGVYSITGDKSIYIDWEPNDESDLKNYWIYRTLNPDNGFLPLFSTTISQYTDLNVSNGTTYYYIITAIDYSGNESEVSKVIYDTPRPEGHNAVLYDRAVDPYHAGIYFNNQEGAKVIPWNSILCDIYLDTYDKVFYLNTTVKDSIPNDIQDMGFTFGWSEINVAPDTNIGWSELGYVPVGWGHTYVIWTWDNRYAKLRVTDIDTIYYNYIRFEWAYQTSEGNPELKVVPKRIANKK